MKKKTEKKGIDKNRFPAIYSLKTEIKDYLKELITARKKLLIALVICFACIIIFGVFFFIKSTPVLWSMLNNDYKFHFTTQVWAKLAAPVRVNMPIDQTFKVPFKDKIHVKLPFKTVMSMPINQTFDIPFRKPVKINLDHTFPINEVVHLKAVIPIDTVANISLFGINKDLGVRGTFPVDVDVPVVHNFRLNDTFDFTVKDPVRIDINDVFNVPIDMNVDMDLPVDMILNVPMKIDFNTEIEINEKLPVIMEFDVIINPLKGVNIEGVKVNGKQVQ